MQNIGERLEEARKKKGISIREAAEATKIRGDYLQKFESNQFDIGLTELYARGFLRNYANFLKLPADRIINDYTALGHGDVRPRQPSREIYGRLDISVASASEASDRAAPPAESSAEPASSRGQAQPRYPRGHSTLPSGPDPAVVFRYIKWGGGIVIALIAVLVLKSLFSGGSPPPPTRNTTVPAASTAAPTMPKSSAGQSYAIVALDTVFVKVTHVIGEDTDGDEIFKGVLSKGQSQTIPWAGPHNVWATVGENVQVEFNGKRLPSGFTGWGHARMPNPPAPR